MKLSKTKLRNDKLMRITQWQNSNIKKEQQNFLKQKTKTICKPKCRNSNAKTQI